MKLRTRAISAGRWTTVSALGRSGLQMLQVVVVARFLAPSDFGLMAITMALLGVLSVLADFGISRGIIHFDHVDQRTRSSLYWLNVLLAAALSTLVVVSAPFIARFYDLPALTWVLAWTAQILFVSSLGQQFNVLAEKELEFAKPAQNELAAALVGFIACVVAAVWLHAGVFALVAGALATAIVGAALAWLRLSAGHRPTFHMDLQEAMPFLRFGGYMMGENAASTLTRQSDIFIGGWFLGSATLGLYSLARDLNLRVSMMINQVVTRVTFPVMSRVKNDPIALADIYAKTMRMTASVNFPVFVFIGVFADEVVMLLYGERFRDAAGLMRVFAVWGLLRSVGNPAGSVLYAVGKARRAFVWNLVLLVLFPLAYWIGLQSKGLDGLLVAVVATQVLLVWPTWRWLVHPSCALPFGAYLREITIPLVAALLAGAGAWAAAHALPHGTVRMAVGGVVGGVIYLGLSALINRPWLLAIREMAHVPQRARR
ncbi:MOP flippase family protein [Noviluteimonas gilva]|uniref:MOP flippase family protein n=1 Tax=Noviluteimonas gilva TaxID=2682097 RepID=A0A7C9LGB1_9GAMM|nr:MOP flippase family protein [Lysobacter gilvus]MUV13821.1 MOP flippase family protein [Lysobacter gilvus]